MKKYIVNLKENNNRIDKVICNYEKDISRVAVQRLINDEKVLVNGKSVKTSYRVCENDIITIDFEQPKEVNIQAQEIPLNIIYEDDDVLVINKEKGMVVHPGNGHKDGTLVNAIMAHCKNDLSGIGGEIRPGIVHRLDKDTSGVLVIAKNDYTHINISNQIKDRTTKKTYLALVRGVIKENEAKIDMPIGRSQNDRKKMAVNKNGKSAITNFKVLKRYSGYTFVEIIIETGRTHQIRVHMSEIGYPIVGDEVYSNGKNQFNVKGQMLHAYKLEFNHPRSGERKYFEAQLPEYFKNVLNELEK